MKIDYTNPFIQELGFLIRIPKIKRIFETFLEQQKEIFKEEISELVKETAGKIRPMPTHHSREHFFQLRRDGETGLWETVMEKNPHAVPGTPTLPAELIRQMDSFDIDPDASHHLEYQSDSYLYKLYFSRYTVNHIAGTVQRIRRFDRGRECPIIEIEHYLGLSLEEQEDLFHQYLVEYPELKREVLFYFYSRILPNSEIFQRLTG